MKAVNALFIVLSIAILTIAFQLTSPLLSRQGTAVAETMTNQGPQVVKMSEFLTYKQYKMLAFAYEIAKQDGIQHPSYLQGILMQESRACNVKHYRVAGLTNKVGDRYFGAVQLKLAAAKDVLKRYPELLQYLDTNTDEEIQAKLILDDEFNIRVGSKYLLMLGINEKPDLAITAYNQGVSGAKGINPKTFHYTKAVNKYFKELNS